MLLRHLPTTGVGKGNVRMRAVSCALSVRSVSGGQAWQLLAKLVILLRLLWLPCQLLTPLDRRLIMSVEMTSSNVPLSDVQLVLSDTSSVYKNLDLKKRSTELR